MTIEELLRRATASVDRGPVRLVSGRFRLDKKGRPLTGRERLVIGVMALGLALAVWLQARPSPLGAHTGYYQALAGTTALDSSAPRPLVEAALLALGDEWRPATLFACVHPVFWPGDSTDRANALAKRLESGLAQLATHGRAVSAMAFPTPSPVSSETINGMTLLTCRVAGQLELADGSVVRFTVRLAQDERTRHWGIVELSAPPFLP
jgi:hypothetical protein